MVSPVHDSARRDGVEKRARKAGERRRSGERGLTFIEVVAAVVILLVLAGAALPIGVNAVRRTKELQLRRALQTMRGSIDEYNKYAKAGAVKPWDPDWEFYPKDFDMLVDGVEVTSPQNPVPKTIRFLRKVPTDPMTGDASWGMRSYQDEWDSDSWGEENLYDVYSLSPGVGLDGTEYRTW